jgi:hypothetical protein
MTFYDTLKKPVKQVGWRNMGDLAENEKKSIIGKRRWIFTGFAIKGVRATAILVFIVFAVYLVGSIADPGFSDRLLFFLLRLLQFSSLLLCAFSLFALAFSVHQLVLSPGLRNALNLCLYFMTAMLGAGFAMLNSMIIAVAGGTG